MSYEDLIDAVQDGAGLSSRTEAEAAVDAFFDAIARHVMPGDRRAVRALLPDALHSPFDQLGSHDDVGLSVIAEEVARAEGIGSGFGREHLHVVGVASVAALHPDAITALRTHLPEDLAVLFAPPPRAVRERKVTPIEVPRASRHLSEARPGGTHPLAEARDERAHTQSIARSDDPHGDTKLSGAKR